MERQPSPQYTVWGLFCPMPTTTVPPRKQNTNRAQRLYLKAEWEQNPKSQARQPSESGERFPDLQRR